jgi:hypothetical protein
MLCAQVILAQHATAHFTEDKYTSIAGQFADEHEAPVNHPAHHKDKTCQICLFSKVLSHTFPFVSVDVPARDFAASFAIPANRETYARRETLPLQPRAPPSFSS